MSTVLAPDEPGILSRGRLRDYAWWQLRDYLINKGIATALISGLLLFVVWSEARDEGITEMMVVAKSAFPLYINNVMLFGVLFATNGIVSEDRKLGYYRFYFSKPVSVAAFYAQKFLVNLSGLVLVTVTMLAIFAQVLAPIYPPPLAAVFPMLIVGLAGIGFLLSAIFTFDWLTLLAVYALAQVGWLLWGDDAGIRGMLVRALPPVHRLGDVYAAVARGEPFSMAPVWWVFLYGLACFFLGLVVVSRRKLATS